MKKLVIVGAGNQARTAYVYFTKDSEYDVVAFAVHEQFQQQKELLGLGVVTLEGLEQSHPPDEYALFVAIGFSGLNKDRAAMFEECKGKGYELVSYLSSRATHWGDLSLGNNCFIVENTSFQPFVRIGSNVVVASGTCIGHDAVIGDHCFIGPGVVIPGGVTIGPYCFIGANATIRNDITIAPECVIGAGSIILKNTVERGIYLGQATEASRLSHRAVSLFMSFQNNSSMPDSGS